MRLLIELALFFAATWAFYDAGATVAAVVFGVLWVLHYAISYDRITWMLMVGGRVESSGH